MSKNESRVFLVVACRMGTIALTSPVGPGEGPRVFSGGGVFDAPGSGWVSTDPSTVLKGRQGPPQCRLTSEAELTQQTLLFRPIPSPACIKSAAGPGLRFEKYRENEVHF